MCDTATGAPPPTSQPRWLSLYAVTLPQLVALAIVEVAGPPSAVRAVVRCGFALGTFVGMGWWVHVSRTALDLQRWCPCASGTVTVRVIESRRPGPSIPVVPAVRVPAEVDEGALIHA